MGTDRRDFLKATAAVTVAGAASAVAETTAGRSEVFVGKGSADEIIPRIFDRLGGAKNFVKPGARVLIKPNMSFANPPEWATTTSPEAVRVVAKLCIEAGAKRVIVCDNTLREPDLCKDKSGIAEAVKGMKEVVVFIPKQPNLFEEKTSDKAKALTKTSVVREIAKSDFFISLPIAKSHSAGAVSLNLKGLMGLIYDRKVMHSEMDLHTAIAEQLYYMKPHLSLVDASRVLLDNGPAGPGKVEELNTFVGGLDPVAVDSFAVTLASWYGRKFEGTNVICIKKAMELGFGNAESGKITETPV